ncbi:nitroreductase family protein [Candidatus Pacearchaeota archaeon]|nr:nitroreductase family protein [Candidatus Aenigmarchaeota archaeon]MBS3074783.1 nitroreductase family protein [Candidatus Pacearchaeota archaeon]
MDFDTLARKRRSVRNFNPNKKPDWKKVIDAIDTANQIPLAGNISILKFIMIEDREKIAKITDACQQDFIQDAHYIVVVCSKKEQLTRNFSGKGEMFTRQEAGAAIQNFLLKVVEDGLASCWIGHFSERILKRLLKIPKDWDIEALLPLGYEARARISSKPPIKPSIEDTVYFEEWKEKKRKK